MSTPNQDQKQALPKPNFCKAYAKAFGEFARALEENMNSADHSKYVDFSSVLAAVKPVLMKYELSISQKIHPTNGSTANVETIIAHASGEQRSFGIVAVPVSKNDAEGYESALVCARRHSLSCALGVAPEYVGGEKDDDGNAACGIS